MHISNLNTLSPSITLRHVRRRKKSLETYQVDASPSLIRLGIHHPQLSKGIAPTNLRAIHAVTVAQEASGRREIVVDVVDITNEGCVGEEAVVEEAALEEEVAQRVSEVPNEEEAEGGAR